jgi:hypothetical protein
MSGVRASLLQPIEKDGDSSRRQKGVPGDGARRLRLGGKSKINIEPS